MDLQDAGRRAPFMIRDRDGKFPSLFDTVLSDAGTEVVLSGKKRIQRRPLLGSLINEYEPAA